MPSSGPESADGRRSPHFSFSIIGKVRDPVLRRVFGHQKFFLSFPQVGGGASLIRLRQGRREELSPLAVPAGLLASPGPSGYSKFLRVTEPKGHLNLSPKTRRPVGPSVQEAELVSR